MKKIDPVIFLGVVSLLYWTIDMINNIFFLKTPFWSLWFSSVGIGLTGIGLLTRNTFLLSSLFCALFFVESGWNVGFFSHVLFDKSFLGLTDYLFDGKYTMKDFVITSYHIVMIPFILIGLLKEKIVHKTAWIGAIIFTTIVALLTYFFVSPVEDVNCIHVIDNCRPFLSLLENFGTPLRIVLGILLMTITVFIPTNYLLVKVLKERKML